MPKVPTQKITASALIVAMGILVPIFFHALGLGSAFLPMFWPLVIGCFFLPFYLAVLTGILTPVLSFIITGMPPISPPILFLLIVQLGVLTGIINLVYNRTRLGIFFSLLIAILIERCVLYVLVVPLSSMLGLPPKLASAAIVIQGLPGVFLILAIIPMLVGRLKSESVFKF